MINIRRDSFEYFLKNFFLWLSKYEIYSFVNESIIGTITGRELEKLLFNQEDESDSAVNWFTNNNTIANPNKFQAIILNKKM